MSKQNCPSCHSANIGNNGSQIIEAGRILRYRCRDCGRTFRGNVIGANLVSRIGHLDIEASQLKADFGHIYCWGILDHKTDKLYFDELKVRSLKEEKRIVQTLVDAMRQFDVLTTYNGTRFDIPFIRTRALYHHVSFPEFGSIYHRDLYFVARGRILTHSRRLEVVSRFLGIPGKTPLDPEVWVAASFGERKAMKYIAEHNKADIKVLKAVYLAFEPYFKPIWRSL